MYPHFACSRAWNGMSSTVRWPMIWQVVVWNKRVLQGNGGVVIYIYIHCIYLACYPYEHVYIWYIYTSIYTHIITCVRKYILYTIYMLYLYFYSLCHVIVTKFTNPSTTWLKGIWAGVPWDFSTALWVGNGLPKGSQAEGIHTPTNQTWQSQNSKNVRFYQVEAVEISKHS